MFSEDIILKPIITEKASNYSSENKYFFKVVSSANKISIRAAIEKLFDVKVEKVNTVSVRGKKRRYGKFLGKTKDWKKAVVTLKEGKIDFTNAKQEKNK